MPLTDESLSSLFRGKTVAADKLKKMGWADQGGSQPWSFVPKKRDLWVVEFDPTFESCEPIRLYLLVQLANDSTVRRVETVVARVLGNGEREDMELPIRYPDDETAKEMIRAILTDGARSELAKQSSNARAVPVSVSGLVQLIGQPDSSAEAKALIERFSLRRSQTLFGEGFSWTCRGSRLEFQTDGGGCITTIFLATQSHDSLADGVPATAGRDTVRSILGPPTRSGDDGEWDRFDGKVALHVSYTADQASTTKITVMARHVAP